MKSCIFLFACFAYALAVPVPDFDAPYGKIHSDNLEAIAMGYKPISLDGMQGSDIDHQVTYPQHVDDSLEPLTFLDDADDRSFSEIDADMGINQGDTRDNFDINEDAFENLHVYGGDHTDFAHEDTVSIGHYSDSIGDEMFNWNKGRNGLSTFTCRDYEDVYYDQQCEDYEVKTCENVFNDKCRKVADQKCGTEILKKPERKCYTKENIFCSLKETVGQETLYEVIYNQRCSSAPEKVCDTVHEATINKQTEQVCGVINKAECHEEEVHLMERTCTSTYKFGCAGRYVKVDGVRGKYYKQQASGIFDYVDSVDSGSSQSDEDYLGDFNTLQGPRYGRDTDYNDHSIGGEGESMDYDYTGSYCKREPVSKCRDIPIVRMKPVCTTSTKRECLSATRTTFSPVAKVKCHEQTTRKCEDNVERIPKALNTYSYRKVCLPRKVSICADNYRESLQKTCKEIVREDCVPESKEACVTLPNKYCYKVPKKVVRQRCGENRAEAIDQEVSRVMN